MVKLFSAYWWTFVARGFIAFLFGLFGLFCPALSLDLLVVTFWALALLQGILTLIPGLSKLGGRVYFLLMEGIVGILAGVLTFIGPGIGRILWPDSATMTLLFVIVFWSVFTGIGEGIGSLRLPGEIKEKWAVTLSGAVSLILGLVLLLRSGTGAVDNAWVIGLCTVIFGLLWVFVGFKARRYAVT